MNFREVKFLCFMSWLNVWSCTIIQGWDFDIQDEVQLQI